MWIQEGTSSIAGPAIPGDVVEAIRHAQEESALPFQCEVVWEDSLAKECADGIKGSRVKLFDF